MSKIIQALKALYVKLGGSAATVANINETPDMINAIAGLDIGGGGSGSSLPAVTSDDNGKVLAVVEGEWDKAEASSGSNDFVVTYTQGEGDTYTADKTFADIVAAYAAGKNIKAKLSAEGTDYCFTLVMMSSGENEGMAAFSALVVESDSVTAFTLTHSLADSTETITIINKSLEYEAS